MQFIFFSDYKPTDKNLAVYKVYLDYFFNMTLIMFWGVILALNHSRLFYYPIMRQFSMYDTKIAYNLSEKALNINPHLKAFMHFAYPFLILMMPLYTLLVGIPFLIPFIPLILYVAFREIFLNKKENEKEEVHIAEYNLKPVHISNKP